MPTPFKSNKQLQMTGTKGAGNPTDDQLALINGFTLKEFQADEVYVRTMYLAHNAIDRDGDVFDDALLADFASTLPGKGLFVKHPMSFDGDSGPGEGLFFAAEPVEMSLAEARTALRAPDLKWPASAEKAVLLQAGFYMVRDDSNKSLITKIDGGIAPFVSIGFRASDRGPITDEQNNRVATRLLGPGEALEGSIVWLGAQPGAHIHKSARQREILDNDIPNPETIEMAMTETETKEFNDAKAKAAKVDGLQLQVDEQKGLVKKVTDKLISIKAAVCGDKDKADKVKTAEVITLVTAGKTYRNTLVDDIIAAKRHKKEMGDTQTDIDARKALYATYGIDMLKEEHVAATKNVPGTASQFGKGDPNAGGGGDGGKKALRNRDASRKAMGLDTKAA